jgi:hypothetical protein
MHERHEPDFPVGWYMWLQEKTQSGEIKIVSIPTSENPAAILTKHVSKATLDHLLPFFGMVDYVDTHGNIGSKIVMENTSSTCRAALRGKIANTSPWTPQLTIALLMAQQAEATCDCQFLKTEVLYYKFVLSVLVGFLVLFIMIYVATNRDPENHVVTYVYVDEEEYHEERECPRFQRRLSSDTFLGLPLPRFRCTSCWHPRGVAEERRRRDMIATEQDRQEYEEAAARHRAWEDGEVDEDVNLFGPSPTTDNEYDPFDDLADAYREENVQMALAQQEVDFETASYEQVLGSSGQY